MSARRKTGRVTCLGRRGSAGVESKASDHGGLSHYTTPGVRGENTYWRDGALSLRHRTYGFHLPCLDLDFVLLEYTGGNLPSGLFEYKRGLHREIDLESAGMQALAHLADAAGIPAAVVCYDPRLWCFKVYCLNNLCFEFFTDGETITELEYVRQLYELRGRTLPCEIAHRLNDVLPRRKAVIEP